MTWFKVDDSFPSHPKVRSIPRRARMSALGVWLACGTWSSKHLTDGVIPADVVEDEGGRQADAKSLVAAGLWHSNGHDCLRCDQPPKDSYVFHDWLDWQPSRVDVLAKREEDAQRKADWRAKKAAERKAESERKNTARPASVPMGHPPDGQWDSARTDSVRPAGVLDARPDPTRPDPTRPASPYGRSDRDFLVAENGDAENRLFEVDRPPPTTGQAIQALVGAYCDAVTGAGGVHTDTMRKAVGRNVKRLIEVDQLDPAVVLVAVQRAGADRSKDLDRFLGEARRTYDRAGRARDAMRQAWFDRAVLIDAQATVTAIGA